MPAPLFPLFADLHGRPVLVVGGGAVAERKTRALREAGAEIRIGAPALTPTLAEWAELGLITHLEGEFQPAWLDDVWLVTAATDHADVNAAVADAANRRRIFANVVDDAALSSVQIPARVQRGPLQVAISSSGAAPMLARHLRERLESELDESLGPLALLLQRLRPRITAQLPDIATRRRFFDTLLQGNVPGLIRAGRLYGATRQVLCLLGAPRQRPKRGRVALVGAGPGDAGLLTLRGLRLLNQADVILHDRLVSPEVLALARRDAECIEVGKQANGPSMRQSTINALMLEHALAGKTVVRLKGGDAFVFGRGGEELQALRAHDIDYEVVPGITAALACGAYAGIPLTHRDHANSLRLLTAHGANGPSEHEWADLARPGQTLAVYMGVAGLANFAQQLITHGRAAATPAALIENGSRPEQRVISATLDTLPALARQHAVASPALLVVGDVAAHADTLHWFGAAPLRPDPADEKKPWPARAA